MQEMVRQAPDPRARDRAAHGDQERPAMTNPAHVHASADSAARQHVPPPRHPHKSRRGARSIGGQSTLTEFHATASPSIASAAAWISRARIGSPRPAKI
jgi:hypothetical protein